MKCCGNCKYFVNEDSDAINGRRCEKWEEKQMNKWQKVLDVINVVQGTDIKMGEEFYVGGLRNIVVMTDSRLRDNRGFLLPNILVGLIAEDIKIKPKQWIPKKGETCYLADPSHIEFVITYPYTGSEFDSLLLERGVIRKTKEEAIALTKKLLEVVRMIDPIQIKQQVKEGNLQFYIKHGMLYCCDSEPRTTTLEIPYTNKSEMDMKFKLKELDDRLEYIEHRINYLEEQDLKIVRL